MKTKPLPEPILRPCFDGRNFVVIRALHVPGCLTVPAGFKTDLASVPRLFWNIFPPTGKYAAAAVVHDFIYRLPGHAGFTRRAADNIFYRECVAYDCHPITSFVMWMFIRIGGSGAWTRNSAELHTDHEN